MKQGGLLSPQCKGSHMAMTADWTGALERARAYAPFLSRAIDRLPDLAALLAAGEGEKALDWARQAGQGEADVAVALRRERLALALTAGMLLALTRRRTASQRGW